jgi:hypothetical protein
VAPANLNSTSGKRYTGFKVFHGAKMRNTLRMLQRNLQSQDQCLAKALYLRIKGTLICLEQELGKDKGTG